MGKSILVTGGARSGKSSFAQQLALDMGGKTLFVATAIAGDEEMAERIRQHQRERPSGWRTLEAADNAGDCIEKNIGQAQVVIIDCITLLLNSIFNRHASLTPGESALVEQEMISEIEGLLQCSRNISASFIIVTNELGLGLVPADMVSRLYRDLLGKANQMLARHCDKVYLIVAGLPVAIK